MKIEFQELIKEEKTPDSITKKQIIESKKLYKLEFRIWKDYKTIIVESDLPTEEEISKAFYNSEYATKMSTN